MGGWGQVWAAMRFGLGEGGGGGGGVRWEEVASKVLKEGVGVCSGKTFQRIRQAAPTQKKKKKQTPLDPLGNELREFFCFTVWGGGGGGYQVLKKLTREEGLGGWVTGRKQNVGKTGALG